jgi:hypothetical protein
MGGPAHDCCPPVTPIAHKLAWQAIWARKAVSLARAPFGLGLRSPGSEVTPYEPLTSPLVAHGWAKVRHERTLARLGQADIQPQRRKSLFPGVFGIDEKLLLRR